MALLALYTVAVIAVLEWAVTETSGNETRHRVEALVPGGVTTLTAIWALAAVWIVVTWLRTRDVPAAGFSVLGLFLVLFGYLLEWSRRVALPTDGGISPSEVWLYLSGGLAVALALGTVLAGVVFVRVNRTARR